VSRFRPGGVDAFREQRRPGFGQTGVVAGTINPIRAAVLRGKVLAGDGSPLAGVTISTQTRADGMFDLAVNGGSDRQLCQGRLPR
jgi:hypothetical protein